MSTAYDQIDERRRRKVGRSASVRNHGPGTVIEWGRQFGAPDYLVYTAVILLDNGELIFGDVEHASYSTSGETSQPDRRRRAASARVNLVGHRRVAKGEVEDVDH